MISQPGIEDNRVKRFIAALHQERPPPIDDGSHYKFPFKPPGPARAWRRVGPVSALCLSRLCRASPQAALAAQAQAHGPISCRASTKSTVTSPCSCRPPPAHSVEVEPPDHRLRLSHRHPMLLLSASTRALDAARLLLRAAVTARPTSTCCRSCARRPPPACRRRHRAHRPPLGVDSRKGGDGLGSRDWEAPSVAACS
jgi:hypothetical protein